MVERLNGKGPYIRRTHGSERRGVFSAPSAASVGYQREQSRRDKARLQELIKTRKLSAESDVILKPWGLELDSGQPESEVEIGGLGNKELPAFKHKQEIVDTIESSKVTILSGETGSGKSTQTPQYLYEAGYDKVYVLVPRRVIADDLSARISTELTWQLGEDAEHKVGLMHGERVDIHEDNRIIVLTPDTFNGILPEIEREHGDKKVAIISDEIHEANLFTEIATGLAAMATKDHDSWRLIASSATHNTDTLMAPFRKVLGDDKAEVPMVTIEGRPFDVTLTEEPDKTPMEVYASLDEQPEKTMIFTSGKKEIKYVIEKTRAAMEKQRRGSSQKTIFRMLHGELTEVELSHVNDPVPEGYKLVIVSSPAGMSGITISGVTHVITDGTINRSELDGEGVSGLRRYYLSRAGIKQQIGRAGRDVPGGVGILAKPITVEEDESANCYKKSDEAALPFVPFDDEKDRLNYEPAEIYHSNLGRVVLRLAALNRRFADINDFIPHKVEAASINNAEQSLSRLGALDDYFKVTKIGEIMNKFPLSPELSRGLAEAMVNSRPIQHMARMAIIAAAAEQGGLQDFSKIGNYWQGLLRPTTSDDFIAQLDIAMGLMSESAEHGESTVNQYVLREYDLHPKKVERAQKCARKILNVMNVKLYNLELTPPLPDEEALIRRDFTSGMVELVYESLGTRNKKRYYRNIHGNELSTERYVSRSVSKPREGSLIAGFPRWFEKHLPNGTMQHNDVVEQVLTVNVDDIVHFANKHDTISIKPLPPRIVGDMVLEQGQRVFGSIDIGKPIAIKREYIPEKTRNMIVRASLERQGTAQRALRSVIEELQYYRQIIPSRELSRYRKTNAPEDVTPKLIETLLHEYAKETRSLTYIDRKIAYYIYSKGIGINRYYDDDARSQMQQRSPKYLQIGDIESELHYDQGVPYVRKLAREQHDAARAGVYLSDGREVMLQISRNGGKHHRMSLRDV